jgi:hypothetical protein
LLNIDSFSNFEMINKNGKGEDEKWLRRPV